jgi:hypothetical protein
VSRLELALERLNSALDLLEGNAETFFAGRDQFAPGGAKFLALETERDRLIGRIAELEDESQALAGLTEEVEDRLDGAIAEIRTALGRQ